MRIPGHVLRFAGLVALIAVLGAGVAVLGVPEPDAVAGAIGGSGLPAPAVAVAACAVLVLGLVPRTLLSAAAGLVFGPLAGTGYVLAGATVGAVVAFGVGRWLGRDFVAAQPRVRRLDGWLTDRGFFGVLVVRLLPIAPFGLVSYGFGTSGVRLRWFLTGTVAGIVPSTVIYAHLGAAAAEPGSPGFWISVAVAAGFLGMTLGLGTWITRRRRAPSHVPG
ncbi:MAG: TVP38/TMEM64 family protein [Micromonosporaceae bacterium]